jgi:hypothetical protein
MPSPSDFPEKQVDRALQIAADEKAGDHWLSHFWFIHKVLGEDKALASRMADRFKHRRLTRSDSEGLIADWKEEGWL